jgi:hypothetical protein
VTGFGYHVDVFSRLLNTANTSAGERRMTTVTSLRGISSFPFERVTALVRNLGDGLRTLSASHGSLLR